MRYNSFLLLFCLLGIRVFADNRVSPTISEVTVYRSGAKLSSVATVKVSAGKSEVIFENLSPYFNPNSLQVRIKGGATLTSAIFSLKTPGPAPEHPRIPILRDSLLLLSDESARIRDERDVLNLEQKMLAEKTAQVGSTNPDQSVTTITLAELRELVAFYRQRLLEIRELQLKLNGKERKLNELFQKLQADLQRLQPNTSNQTGEISLKIEAAAAQTLEITCNYLVTQAGWAPVYDLRSEGMDKPLQLVYKANISNRSGFDWKGVKLHLSTASPLLNNDRPILTPVFVDFRVMAAMPTPGTSQIDGGEVNIRGSRSNAINYRVDGIRVSGSMPPVQEAEMQRTLSEVSEEQFNQEEFTTNFDLEKLQDILADGEENIVTVDERDMPAAYEFHSVPKLEAAVFLLAKVADYGQYNLLPGTANLFFQDTYVGRAWVNPKITADTLLLSLGRDEQISIKRDQPRDFTQRKKIFGSSIKETYTYEISIKNNKSTAVTVDLLDQIPVSRQADIVVELEDKGGAKYGADLGKLEWQITVPAGQTKKVRFTYSVKYPKGKSIDTFRH